MTAAALREGGGNIKACVAERKCERAKARSLCRRVLLTSLLPPPLRLVAQLIELTDCRVERWQERKEEMQTGNRIAGDEGRVDAEDELRWFGGVRLSMNDVAGLILSAVHIQIHWKVTEKKPALNESLEQEKTYERE